MPNKRSAGQNELLYNRHDHLSAKPAPLQRHISDIVINESGAIWLAVHSYPTNGLRFHAKKCLPQRMGSPNCHFLFRSPYSLNFLFAIPLNCSHLVGGQILTKWNGDRTGQSSTS